MIKNLLKYKNNIIFAAAILNILFIIFIIGTLVISSNKKKEGVVNMDALGKLQQSQTLNTSNLKHSSETMKQIITLNSEIKKITDQNALNVVGIVGLENAIKKFNNKNSESFSNIRESLDNNNEKLKKCDDNCSPGENEYIQIFREANQHRGEINSMLGWVKISNTYDKIYNKLLIDISTNKKSLNHIVFQIAVIENQKKKDAQKKMSENKDYSEYKENFSNLEGFSNQDIAKLDEFIVQNTALIHGIDVKFSAILEQMNKIKSLKEVIEGQTLQIKKIHKKLETVGDSAAGPGSTSYIKKNPNAKASDFVNTTPITGRPT